MSTALFDPILLSNLVQHVACASEWLRSAPPKGSWAYWFDWGLKRNYNLTILRFRGVEDTLRLEPACRGVSPAPGKASLASEANLG
jgi:hypothetical protein